ncbi:MAG: 2-hydroxyacid dehydrogenase [Gammaproteobacteria bacterium]|nr:MAG: 2-hydroxyacid dehydrogenase [Gammaproteobacteria bacterium]
MKVAIYSARAYDREFLDRENTRHGHELVYIDAHLDCVTAPLAAGFPAVCLFVNDHADAKALDILAKGGTRYIVLRCAGFNQVDLEAARSLGMTVARVPAYSPYAVAEHAVALIQTLNRKTHRAWNRVREGNFSLGGLLGFDLHGKTVGVIGTGRIGSVFANIMQGFGCRVLAFDPVVSIPLQSSGVTYVPLETLLQDSDIISLHCPLTPDTHHLINGHAIRQMKAGVMLINTSRGAVIDSSALIQGLKSGHIGHVGLDVYEEEDALFFEDLSNQVIQDDVFARLTTFPNVLITGHQAFFTSNAMQHIAETTLENIRCLGQGLPCAHIVQAPNPIG